MHIHEYQAKKLFRSYGIPVSEGKEAFCLSDINQIVLDFGNCPVVLKAQIHSGGRGKAGGVLPAASITEALNAAKTLFGKRLYTKQTGPEGKKIHCLLVEKQVSVRQEFYLSLLIDPNSGKPAFIASSEGGMDIEETAEIHPEKICMIIIDPVSGYRRYHGLQIANSLGIPSNLHKSLHKILDSLYQMFLETDCSLIEINPLALTFDDRWIALDAKVDLDSSAFFRHPENAALRDRKEEPELEALAADSDMNYVSLNGNIGCLVIGAGLGMSTMDAVQYFGGKPANFMDCGGSVTAVKAKKAFQIVAAGKGVDGILVNIFGGITRTDLIAEGILEALKETENHIPLVIRLEGTGSRRANELLANSGIELSLVSSLSDGARKIISLLQERSIS